MAQMIIPSTDLFIVTSALHTNIGVVNVQDRVEQTIEGLKSLRKAAPNALIFLVDASSKMVDEATAMRVNQLCNRSISFFGDEDLMSLANAGLKSQAEITLLFKTLSIIKQHPELQKMMADVRRVFKLSGRTNMLEGYDPKAYDNQYGKYVFKKAIPSWLPPQKQLESGCDHLYITRMYSFCISLFDNYLNTLPAIYQTINQHGVDTEHAHYGNIDKGFSVEFEKLYCQGVLAGNGQLEAY
jgi:ubiquinone/menaquinone biosynthesis C-methylase UbiE